MSNPRSTRVAARLAGVLLVSGALVGCASAGSGASVSASSGAAVTPGSTFAWAPADAAAQAAADPRIADPTFQSRLQQAIETALSAKGYRRADDPKSAQLLVAYHVGLQPKTATTVRQTVDPRYGSCGYYSCVQSWGVYGPPSVDVRRINYTEGRLVLDLVDAASGKLAWRAVSTKRVDHDQASQETLNAVLSDTTRSLPGR